MKLLILCLFIPVISFSQQRNANVKAIHKIMADQQDAWNNFNIESFMEGYWKSDSLKFIGKNGITYGWDSTLENYKKIYPSKEAMGKLTFTIISLDLISDTSAFMIGKYHLKRKNDEPSGHFTLLWLKIDGKWLIVADHSS